MVDIIEKLEWDQMKTWTQSIYKKTMGSTPTISDTTQGGIILAAQAQELQNLLNTAYDNYVVDACSSHNTTVKTMDHTSQYSSHKSGHDSSNNSTYKYSNLSSDTSYADRDHDAANAK